MISAIQTRVLGRTEFADYEAHLKRLDCASRRARFAGTIDDVSIDTHCTHLADENAIVIGAFCDGVLCGAAEIVPVRCGRAEAAFTVEQHHQAQGIGGVLMRAVIDAVRDAGISKLLFEVLPDNSAMIGLIRRNGGPRFSNAARCSAS